MLRLEGARAFVALSVKRNGRLSRSQNRAWGRDRLMQDAVTALAVEKYETEKAVNAGLGDDDDNADEESGLMRFFQWLIDNQDSIKAFVEMIMAMFMTPNPNALGDNRAL